MRQYIGEIEKLLREEFGEAMDMSFIDEQGDGKHFFLDITSEKFIGKNRIQQSQMVYKVLDPYMKTGFIHALRMKCRIPTEENQ